LEFRRVLFRSAAARALEHGLELDALLLGFRPLRLERAPAALELLELHRKLRSLPLEIDAAAFERLPLLADGGQRLLDGRAAPLARREQLRALAIDGRERVLELVALPGQQSLPRLERRVALVEGRDRRLEVRDARREAVALRTQLDARGRQRA